MYRTHHLIYTKSNDFFDLMITSFMHFNILLNSIGKFSKQHVLQLWKLKCSIVILNRAIS